MGSDGLQFAYLPPEASAQGDAGQERIESTRTSLNAAAKAGWLTATPIKWNYQWWDAERRGRFSTTRARASRRQQPKSCHRRQRKRSHKMQQPLRRLTTDMKVPGQLSGFATGFKGFQIKGLTVGPKSCHVICLKCTSKRCL